MGRTLFVICALVALGLATVRAHTERRCLGYRIEELNAERGRLANERRALEAHLAGLRRPVMVRRRVRELGLGLVPAGEGTPAGARTGDGRLAHSESRAGR